MAPSGVDLGVTQTGLAMVVIGVALGRVLDSLASLYADIGSMWVVSEVWAAEGRRRGRTSNSIAGFSSYLLDVQRYRFRTANTSKAGLRLPSELMRLGPSSWVS